MSNGDEDQEVRLDPPPGEPESTFRVIREVGEWVAPLAGFAGPSATRGQQGADALTGSPLTANEATAALSQRAEGEDLLAQKPESDLPPSPLHGMVANRERTAPSAAAKAGSGQKDLGYIETEFSPPTDPKLLAMQALHQAQLADIQILDHEARAQSLDIMTGVYDRLETGLLEDYEGTKKRVEQTLAEAEQELAEVDGLIDAARSNRINPGQFFANVGSAGRFASAIAVGAGAMASAFGGGPNVAYQIISAAIDRNVRAQIVNQAHDRAMVSHQLNYVNTIRGLASNQMNMGNVTRAMLTAIAQAQVAEAASKYASDHFRLSASAVIPQLGNDIVEAHIRANQNIKYRARLKINNLQKANAVMGAVKSLAEGKSAAGGKPIATRKPVRGPAQGQAAPADYQSLLTEDVLASKSHEEMAGKLATEFARSSGRSRSQVTREGIDALVDSIRPVDPDLADALRNVPDSEFIPDEQKEKVTWYSPRLGKEISGEVRNKAAWDKLSEKDRSDYKSAVGKAGEISEQLRDLHKVLGVMSRGEGALGDLVRAGSDGVLVAPILGTRDEKQLMNKITVLVKSIANQKRTELGSDAVRSTSEWKLWESLATGEVTRLSQLADVIQKNSDIRQGMIEPYIEEADNNFKLMAGQHLIVK